MSDDASSVIPPEGIAHSYWNPMLLAIVFGVIGTLSVFSTVLIVGPMLSPSAQSKGVSEVGFFFLLGCLVLGGLLWRGFRKDAIAIYRDHIEVTSLMSGEIIRVPASEITKIHLINAGNGQKIYLYAKPTRCFSFSSYLNGWDDLMVELAVLTGLPVSPRS